jgi:hypothetical protein
LGVWGRVREGGSGRCAEVGGEFLQEADDEEAWDGAEDCVEDEVVCEQGYAEGVLLRGNCVSILEMKSMVVGDKSTRRTLSAPMKPNTLSTFAKCRYQLKLLARWYGSSGSWWNNSERTLLVSVATATTRVIVLFTYCISSCSIQSFEFGEMKGTQRRTVTV